MQVERSLDLRHIGRVNDKEMPIEAAGMAAGGTKIAERSLLDFASTQLIRSAVE